MTFGLQDPDAPVPTTGLPPIEGTPLSFGDRFDATTDAARLRMDSWGREAREARALAEEIARSLGDDATGNDTRTRNRSEESRRNRLFRQAQQTYRGVPDAFIPVPTNEEDFQAALSQRLRVEYQDLQDTLALAPEGAWSAELLGELWAGATDHTTVLTLPIGGGAGSLAKVVGTNVVAGVAAEAMSLPGQFDMAERLDIEDPNAVAQLTFAGVVSGGLSGGLYGAGRYLSYRAQRDALPSEFRPDDTDYVTAQQRVADEEKRLIDGPDAAPRDGGPNARPPAMSDFNFAPGGNAAPRTNPVGYVFGRLLSLGYEPHIAAGLMGNFMQESGTRLNTAAVGDNGAAIGMGQWNGPRQRALRAFAAARDEDWTNIDTQIAFFHHEMQTSERGAAARILAAPDAATAARIASEAFWRPGIPHLDRRINFARQIAEQYQTGRVPRWDGQNILTTNDVPRGGPTTRGYTRQGQVTAGRDMRIDVEYEVVDAALLRQASGDLQPRNRSRSSSDEQIADIAASLDPARLMPSPEADRGAPIVGPDNTIESGNGRTLAILRAAERHPDRYDTYVKAIQDQGFIIPEGVERPVLIARRTSDMAPEARQQFVRAANSSAVARLSATERAASDARVIGDDVIRAFDPAEPLMSGANGAAVRRALAALPQAERNALVDATGRLNREGMTRLREAMFARAFDAPDIIARYAETDAGDLRSLLDALEEASPGMAVLKAEIAAGRTVPDMDISGHVMDAVRMIATSRSIAAREGGQAAKILDELLDEVDLIEGPVAPLTAALVRKFHSGGRTLPADKIATFLNRYAAEARKVGSADRGLFGETPAPVDVLKAIDAEGFADLTTVGPVRGTTGLAEPDLRDPAIATAGADLADPAVREADDLSAAQLREMLDDTPAEGEAFDTIGYLAAYEAENPAFAAARADVESRPSTHRYEGFGTDAFWQSREYVANGEKILGKDAAVAYLYREAAKLPWAEDGLSPPASVTRGRTATIVLGPPASGKSTVANPIARARGAAIIDADEAKKIVPEYADGRGVSAVHIESGELTTDLLAMALANGDNVVLPRVGGKLASIEALTNALKALDYSVEIIEVATPPEVAVQRMIARYEGTGRLIPADVMAEGIDGAPKTYQALKETGLADAYAKIDNSPALGEPRIIVEDDGIVPADLGRTEPGRSGASQEPGRAGGQADIQSEDGLTGTQARPKTDLTEADVAAMRATSAELRAAAKDLDFELEDGTRVSVADILDDLDADDNLLTVLDACNVGRAG